ncbi:MAG: hypothetical protein IJ002_02145 [Clostridia bacterium]|nr:hypothetical protein [Clostridia bacterium]
MKIKTELLKDHIISFINDRIEDFVINADEIANSKAISILGKIQQIIQNEEYKDFDVVEEIVCLFEANGLNCGGRHDF